MLLIQNLTFGYKKEYSNLFDVNLEIQEKEKINIVSTNLEGTILLRILCGLEKKYQGKIFYNQTELKHIDFRRDISLAYLPQNPILFENKTGQKNLEYFAKIHKAKNVQNKSLFNLLNKKVKDMSLFEKYLLSLLRANLRKVDILLLDNIFENLSQENQDKILNFIKQNFENSTIILASKNCENEFFSRKIYFEFGSIKKDTKK